jgi:hypothetical protein
VEWFVDIPPVDLKVAVQRQDFTRVKLIGQMDQASVREIHFTVPVFSKHPLNLRCGSGELKRNLKSSRHHVFKNRIGRAGQRSKEIATLRDHCLACHQRPHGSFESRFTGSVMALAESLLCRAEPVSLSKTPQMFLVGTKVCPARGELPQAGNLWTPMTGVRRSQQTNAFAHHLGEDHGQAVNEMSNPLHEHHCNARYFHLIPPALTLAMRAPPVYYRSVVFKKGAIH